MTLLEEAFHFLTLGKNETSAIFHQMQKVLFCAQKVSWINKLESSKIFIEVLSNIPVLNETIRSINILVRLVSCHK
jgi:hypothetical protein